MKRPSWRLLAVLAAVLAIHLGVWVWWLQAQSVSGEGAWQVSSSRPFRVRATVVKDALPVSRKPEIAPIPLRSTPTPAPGTQVPSMVSTLPMALAAAGEKRPWAPLPSDYLAAEQVDAFPHPQDDWRLDWSQVPATQVGWRVTARLWVSATGQVDHVDMLDSEPHADWINLLLAPLAQTPMVSAQLAGQAVPVTYVVQLAPDQLP
ncbi:MAG: hypothetical protein KGL57_11815 [Burkholderiales bacterium]|nr:hypothetical protein [Burkholderiales bacterium]